MRSTHWNESLEKEVTAAVVTAAADFVHEMESGGPGSGRHPGCEVCGVNTKGSLCPKCNEAVQTYRNQHGVNHADAIDDLKEKYNKQGEQALRKYSSTFHGDLEQTLKHSLNVKSAWDGVVKATYPDSHEAAMRVPKGGSSCASCKYLVGKDECSSKYYQKWNGNNKIPLPADEYCSDWYEPKDKDIDAGGPGSGRHKGLQLKKFMQIHEAIAEWKTKERKMGCVAATDWFCKRVQGFKPERLARYTPNGELFQHVVATDGTVRIDLAPYADKPDDHSMDAATEVALDGDQKGSLWNGIKICGFTGPEEEALRAMLSRCPPELLFNVKEIKSAKELYAKHGKFDPETKTISFNPHNWKLRVRYGKGDGWMQHAETTIIHEVGHSIYEALTPEKKAEWLKLGNWQKGWKVGQAPAYEETRPGWPHAVSEWTHVAGWKLPRYYSSRNPNEAFSDCFSFFLLSKSHQMEPSIKQYMENLVKDNVKKYPSVSIQSPDKPYGTQGN